MKQEIKQRIERINLGEVPEGYKADGNTTVPIEWKISKVKSCMEIRNNLRTPISEQERFSICGEYPYYGPTKIQGYINNYSIEGKHVLIGEDGDHFLKYKDKDMTLLVGGKFNVNNHAHVLRGTQKCMTEWFFYNFKNKSLSEYLTRQGAGRYKLTKDSLERIKVILPPLPEQEKIADILSTWDKSIELKEQYVKALEGQKKALMQHLLTGTVRLSGFTDEWNEFRLKTLLIESNNRNKDLTTDIIYSISNKSGFIPQDEQFDKIVASKDISNYKIISKGCIAYNPSRINVGSIASFDLDFDVVVSPMYVVFKCKEKLLITDFMRQWISSHTFDQQMKALLSGSVRDSLNFSDLGLIKINLPPIKEQKAIIQVLYLADFEISLKKAELAILKLQKKGLMQVLLTGKVRVAT